MFPDFKSWSAATRAHQAHLLKTQIEILRRRKYRPGGGFTFDSFIDDRYKTTSGIIDQSGTTKPAFDAVAQACAETIIIADPFFDLISKEKAWPLIPVIEKAGMVAQDSINWMNYLRDLKEIDSLK